jgi:hypothetical protein
MSSSGTNAKYRNVYHRAAVEYYGTLKDLQLRCRCGHVRGVANRRLKLTAGTDPVRCLQFSSRVFRWYADCCRTPIGNTASPRFPVMRPVLRGCEAGQDRPVSLLG